MARKMALLDWRAMKYFHIRGILLPICVVIIGLFSSPVLVMPTCTLLFVFFSLNPFAVEEKGALNNLYLTLPVKRSTIVSGRFILGGIMGACGVILSIPLTAVVNHFGWSHYDLPLSWYVFVFCISYLLFAVFIFATYPTLFKLGYQKGKFWGFAIPAVFMGLLYGVFSVIANWPGNEMLLFNLLKYASENMLLISGGIAVAATAILAASIMLSKHIYSKREF